MHRLVCRHFYRQNECPRTRTGLREIRLRKAAKTGTARAAEVSSTKAAATKAPTTEVTTAATTTTTTAAAASPYRLTKSNKTGDY